MKTQPNSNAPAAYDHTLAIARALADQIREKLDALPETDADWNRVFQLIRVGTLLSEVSVRLDE